MNTSTEQRLCCICRGVLSVYNKTDRCVRHNQSTGIRPLFKIVNVPEEDVEDLFRVRQVKDHSFNSPQAIVSTGITPDGLLDVITLAYGVERDQIFDKERTAVVARARQVFMYLLRTKFKQSLPEIGSFLNRDHTTVLYGCEQIAQKIKIDSVLAKEIDLICENAFAKTET